LVSQEELIVFLAKKCNSKDTAKFNELVDLTFTQMDRDNNGKVSLEEFSNMYFTELIRLEEEVEELQSRI